MGEITWGGGRHRKFPFPHFTICMHILGKSVSTINNTIKEYFKRILYCIVCICMYLNPILELFLYLF